jgi:rod shape-determining protein MreC
MEYTPPPFFKRGPAPLVRLALCLLVAATLLVCDARYHYIGGVRQVVGVIMYPLLRLAAAPVAALDRMAQFFVSNSALRSENARLTERNLENAATMQSLQSLAAENTYLRGLLGARDRLPVTAAMAQVIYGARDPFTRKVIIDKGSQNDVKAGQPVIDDIGVVGQVTLVYPWLAEVTLITDPDQTVPVQNTRNGLRAIIAGSRDGQLELKFIPLNADFQNGDRLVTSGIDGTYPPGLPVAEVANVERNTGYLFARITCRPLAGVDSRSQVLLVTWENKLPPRPEAEQKKLPAQRSRRSPQP